MFCSTLTSSSIWLEGLQRTAGLNISVNTGQNAVLQAFFWRLTHLLSLPVAVLFVFDGPDRPGIKRGKQVKGTPHWMENGAKSFIEAFGFQHITVRPIPFYFIFAHLI